MKKKYSYFKAFLLLGASTVWVGAQVNAMEKPEIPVSTTITSASSIEEIRAELEQMDVYVLDFTMNKGEFPTCDFMEHPEGCNGSSIINNDYVDGRFTIKKGNDTLYDSGEYVKKESGVRLKLRGNTSSGPEIKKKSYKVKLSKKADLLLRDDNNLKDKDWVLLGMGGKQLNYVAGAEVARVCGMPWEPVGRHVAVIMNNEYMGCYYLCEAVGAGSHRVDIEDSGYVVENDSYWWKPDEVYFKSNHQLYELGWTFKEPDTDDFDEMSLENIKWAVNTAEQKLYNDKDATDMIDYDSFATWMLAHDIMMTLDGYGSNMFVVKKDFDPYSPFSSKLQAGPIWDFDTSLEGNDDRHAAIATLPGFWIHKMWDDPYFKSIYKEKWIDLREKVGSAVLRHVEEYINANPDLYKMRLMDEARGILAPILPTDPVDDYNKLVRWFDVRGPQLDRLLDITGSNIEKLPANDEGTLNNDIIASYTLDGVKTDTETKGVVISVDSAGKAVKRVR